MTDGGKGILFVVVEALVVVLAVVVVCVYVCVGVETVDVMGLVSPVVWHS